MTPSPHAMHCRAAVVENVPLASDTDRIRLAAPAIASRIVPGQFVMLRLPDTTDPLLGRAFALYDTYLDAVGQPAGIDVVYLLVGKMTHLMSRLPPASDLDVWGPLGNGFPLLSAKHVLLVAGGIGQTPFLALARECLGLRQYGLPPRTPSDRPRDREISPNPNPQHPTPNPQSLAPSPSPAPADATRSPKVTLCYGARTAALLAGVHDFDSLGVEVRLATDDGTAGHRGLVTQLVENTITRQGPPDVLVGCGPEPMLAALARLAETQRLACLVSMETPMACGFGACFSCVARVRQPDGTADWRRVCVDGPVFDAARIVFQT